MVFHYCKFFVICVFTFYFLSSCTSGNIAPKDKKKLVIRITGSNSTTGKLIMINEKGDTAENFQAWSGQKIKWDIDDRSNVKSIKDIFPKANNQTVFSEKPKKLFLSKNWQGTLKETKDTLFENYNIDWIEKDNNYKHTYDPLIQVNPK